MDVPHEYDLEDDGDEDDDEDGEENWLVVEDSNGLRRGADAAKPIELAHCDLNGRDGCSKAIEMTKWPCRCVAVLESARLRQ
jgi:hypothetical protein